MVTVENSPAQSVGGEALQTQNPQTMAPSNLQPNQTQDGLQNVVSSSSLFNSPQANAIVTVPGVAGLTTESLLASEADNQTSSAQNNMGLAVTLIVAVFAIVIGSYFILQQKD